MWANIVFVVITDNIARPFVVKILKLKMAVDKDTLVALNVTSLLKKKDNLNLDGLIRNVAGKLPPEVNFTVAGISLRELLEQSYQIEYKLYSKDRVSKLDYAETIAFPKVASQSDQRLLSTPTLNTWLFQFVPSQVETLTLSSQTISEILFGQQNEDLSLPLSHSADMSAILSGTKLPMELVKQVQASPKVIDPFREALFELSTEIPGSSASKSNFRMYLNSQYENTWLEHTSLSTAQSEQAKRIYDALMTKATKNDPSAAIITLFLIKTETFPTNGDINELAKQLIALKLLEIPKTDSEKPLTLEDKAEIIKRMTKVLLPNLVAKFSFL